MGQSRRQPERRSGSRPRNGDTQPCPHCAKGQAEFSERFRFDGVMGPAWVCDNPACPVKFVSARHAETVAPSGKILLRMSKQVRAKALRTIMKALPDDTRLWAALQDASGGAWGGTIYDVDAILTVLAARRKALQR